MKCSIISQDDTGVTMIKGLYTDGAIYCKLRVEPVTFVSDRRFDLNNQQYFLLLAAGSGLSGNCSSVTKVGSGHFSIQIFVSRRYEINYFGCSKEAENLPAARSRHKIIFEPRLFQLIKIYYSLLSRSWNRRRFPQFTVHLF